MGEVSKQGEEKIIGKIAVLEIYQFSHQIVVVCELDNDVSPKAGMHLRALENSYKITGVGMKRNLINAPTYKNHLPDKNIRELYFNWSNDFEDNIRPGIVANLVIVASGE